MKIDLLELGEGQHVVIRDPKKMNWRKQKAITTAFKGEDDIEGQLDATELLAIGLIKSGYVLDEDDKPVHFPLTQETVGDVPGVVLSKVALAYADAQKEAKPKNS